MRRGSRTLRVSEPILRIHDWFAASRSRGRGHGYGKVGFHPDAMGTLRRSGGVMDVDRLVIGGIRRVGQGLVA